MGGEVVARRGEDGESGSEVEGVPEEVVRQKHCAPAGGFRDAQLLVVAPEGLGKEAQPRQEDLGE